MIFLGALGGAASAVHGLLAGPAMTIGGIELAGLEVPATVPFGGTQATVVHDLPGGGRVIETMGAHDRDIEWSGIFLGVSAVSRARQLDKLRIDGKPVIVIWSDFRKKVVIKSFEADYGYAGGKIGYHISCTVLPEPSSPAKPNLLEQLKSDINKAVGFDVSTYANKAISIAQQLIPIAAVITRGSPAYFALTAAVGTASAAVGAVSTVANSTLANQAIDAAKNGNIFGGASGLQTTSDAQTSLAQSVTASSYINRASSNLAVS